MLVGTKPGRGLPKFLLGDTNSRFSGYFSIRNIKIKTRIVPEARVHVAASSKVKLSFAGINSH